MYLESNAESYKDIIYGFSNNLDPIPLIFVPDLMEIVSLPLNIGSLAYDTCKLFFSETNCWLAKGTMKILGYSVFNLIRPFVLRSKKTAALEGLMRSLDTIGNIITKYQADPSSIHIRNHVGTFYQLEWKNNGESLSFEKAKLNDNSQIRRLGLSSLISKAVSLPDHDPRFYRYAVVDDKIDNCTGFSCFSADKSNERPKIRKTLLNVTKPSWVPDFPRNYTESGDDIVSWDKTTGASYYSFGWYSDEEKAFCTGRSYKPILSDFDNIYYLRCLLDDKDTECIYDASLEEQQECQKYVKPSRSEQDRCNTKSGDDDCDYYSKHSHDKKSTIDYWNTYKKCNTEGSCTSVQSIKPIISFYLGSNALYDIKPVDYALRKTYKMFGDSINLPAFQHTALFLNLGENSDGVIITYGEYYSENYNYHLNCDGVKYYGLSFDEFKKRYTAFDVQEMYSPYNYTVSSFLDVLREWDGWRAYDYDFLSHNCQDFTAEIISKLKLSRKNLTDDDEKIPPKILHQLQFNEKMQLKAPNHK